MPEEGDELAHAPGPGPVDAVGGELLGVRVGGVEEAEGGGDEGRDFAVCEGEEEALAVVVGDVVSMSLSIFTPSGTTMPRRMKLRHQLRRRVQPWKAQVRR